MFDFFIVWIPRLWYFKGLQHRIVKMSMLRGGKAVKFETHSLSGDKNFSWVENYNFHPLTEDQKNFDDRDAADFLTEEGQLKHDFACQLDDYTEFGVNQQDIVIKTSFVYWILTSLLGRLFLEARNCSSSGNV